MEKLFDTHIIQSDSIVTESYIGYGKDDLSKMTKLELNDELKRVNNDIQILQKEIEDADSYPSYAIKERLENAEWYKNKVEKEITERDLTKKFESVETLQQPKSMQDMIKDLDRQFETGMITKNYRDKYIAKLKNAIKAYEEEKERNKAKEEKEKEKELNKHHIFKSFKKKLSDYKK